jgi:threonine synthase
VECICKNEGEKMKFIGTRGTDKEKSFSEVILDPAAPNGGLYVPKKFPKINEKWLFRYYDQL